MSDWSDDGDEAKTKSGGGRQGNQGFGRGGRGGFRGGYGRGGSNDDGGFRGGGGFRRNDVEYSNGETGRRGGFGGGRGGGGGFRRNDDEDGNDESGGGRRGGFGGGRGRGGGFRRNDDEDGNDESGGGRRGGFGGGRGRGGGFRRNDDEDGNDESGGGRRGGFGGSRGRGGGYRRDDDDGFNDDSGGRRGGFGGGRGRGGGGGFRRNDDEDGNDESGGGRRGGFGEGRGRGGGSGFRRDAGDENGGRSYNRNNEGGDGEEKPRERYVPPEPTDDENVLFGSGTAAGINFNKYENIEVKVTGENPVQGASTFEECGLRDFVLSNVKKSGYKTPTPVQKQAIPIMMAGRDLMACAQTGSGKTAAFLVPIINALLDQPKEVVINENGVEPQAVVLSPTRELALQIAQEARKFAHLSILKVCVAYGGTSVYHQAQILMRGCHILVATPGRLNDFVSKGRVTFESTRFFVLDEADRMLDMGFQAEVEKMLNHPSMPPVGNRQTVMFSATFPAEIQRMAGKYLSDYLFLTVGIVGGACTDVEQSFFEVSRFDKREKLCEVLRANGNGQILTLVFVEQKRTADFVAAFLSENKFPTTSIHGDRLQSQRETALADFRSGRMPTLIATGVASRGLDVKNVAHVINYDLPSDIDEYVHRIGRTGRVGNQGKATSFFDADQDGSLAGDLVRILKQADQNVPPFLEVAGAGGGSFQSSQFGGRDVRKGGQKHVEATPQPAAAQEVEEDW